MPVIIHWTAVLVPRYGLRVFGQGGLQMSERKDLMHVGVFFKNTGHHIAAWRHPDSQYDAGINVEHYAACAQMSEQAGFDFLFFADSAAVRETDLEPLSRSSQYTAYFEPTTLLSALAMVTKRIGLVATQTTSGIVTLIEGGRNRLQHCPFRLPRSRNPTH